MTDEHKKMEVMITEAKKWLDWCDTCIMILPCGNSAHMEAGYAKGSGKELIIFGQFLKGERDVMYGFADAHFRDNEILSLVKWLERDPRGETA